MAGIGLWRLVPDALAVRMHSSLAHHITPIAEPLHFTRRNIHSHVWMVFQQGWNCVVYEP